MSARRFKGAVGMAENKSTTYPWAPASSYEISFQLNGVRCREKIRLPPSKINLDHLVNLRGEILNKIERGTFDYVTYFPKSARAKTLAKKRTF